MKKLKNKNISSVRRPSYTTRAFTLIELIVVITILAILWTIAFISLQWYSSQARDSVRISDIKSAELWLELYILKAWRYPVPDEYISYTWWSVEIRQWVLWKNATNNIDISKVLEDPLTNENYVYSTFWDWKYYQILAEKENSELSFIQNSYAESSKIPLVKWNYNFDPSLPSIIVVPDSVTWSWIFDSDVCFVLDSWKNTLDNCLEKKSEMSLNQFDNGLVWYWDMETLFNSWGIDYLKDLTWNWNDWIFSWGMDYSSSLTWGVLWEALNFGWDDYILVNNAIRKPEWEELWITLTFLINPKYSANERTRAEFILSNWTWEQWTWSIFLKSRTCCEEDIIFYMKKEDVDGFGSPIRYKWRWTEWNNNNLSSEQWYLLSLNLNYDWTIAIYSNWKKVAFLNKDRVVPWPYKNPSDLYIWNILSNINHWFMWNIDEVKVYERSLTDLEIIQQAKVLGF